MTRALIEYKRWQQAKIARKQQGGAEGSENQHDDGSGQSGGEAERASGADEDGHSDGGTSGAAAQTAAPMGAKENHSPKKRTRHSDEAGGGDEGEGEREKQGQAEGRAVDNKALQCSSDEGGSNQGKADQSEGTRKRARSRAMHSSTAGGSAGAKEAAHSTAEAARGQVDAARTATRGEDDAAMDGSDGAVRDGDGESVSRNCENTHGHRWNGRRRCANGGRPRVGRAERNSAGSDARRATRVCRGWRSAADGRRR